MQNFQGTLQPTSGRDVPLQITFQIDAEASRVRILSDRRRIGSWDAEDIHVKRESIFRFLIRVDEDDQTFAFSPDDPSGFAQAIPVEIDLAEAPKPRFGLAERLRQAAGA